MSKLFLLALAVLALILRLYQVDAPPDDFHLARQYNSLLVARAFYVNWSEDADSILKRTASANRQYSLQAESPLSEKLMACANVYLGKELFWTGRILPITAWLISAYVLFLIVRRVIPYNPACFLASAIYLIHPFGITVSRSFQPEALVLLLYLLCMWGILKYFDHPTISRFIPCLLLAILSTLSKPGVVLFSIGLIWLSESYRMGGIKMCFSMRSLGFGCALLSPLIMKIINPGDGFGVNQIASANFIPAWLLTGYFWKGWLVTVEQMAGGGILVLGMLGWLMLPDLRSKRFTLAGLTGYIVLSLYSTFTTPSHDYWHLQLFPWLLIGVAALSRPVLEHLLQSRSGTAGIIGAAILSTTLVSFHYLTSDVRHQGDPAFKAMALEIGKKVNHSDRCLILDYVYGRPLAYFGHLAGTAWPEAEDLSADAARGVVLTPQERYDQKYKDLQLEYFIFSRNFKQLDLQPGLREFLAQFPVVARGNRYLIYRLQ